MAEPGRVSEGVGGLCPGPGHSLRTRTGLLLCSYHVPVLMAIMIFKDNSMTK